MLIGLSLTVIILVSLLNIVLGSEFSTYTLNCEYSSTVGIDALTGTLAIIITLSGVAALIGIQILGSGLADESVRVVFMIIIYATIWGFFSVLSFNLIVSIEEFGAIIYLSLTMLYLVGLIQRIGGKST